MSDSESKSGTETVVRDIVHTPGPWTQHKKNGRVIVAGGTKIATAADTASPPVAWRNAELISMSPEMHQAIQLAIACLAGGFEVETADELAEKHPAAAGALRVLLPFAKPRTMAAIKRKVV